MGEVGRPRERERKREREREETLNHLSVHQWLRSAIRDSQQPTSPIGFLFLKLPPPPCAVHDDPTIPRIMVNNHYQLHMVKSGVNTARYLMEGMTLYPLVLMRSIVKKDYVGSGNGEFTNDYGNMGVAIGNFQHFQSKTILPGYMG